MRNDANEINAALDNYILKNQRIHVKACLQN